MALAVDEAHGVAEAGRRRRDELEVELRRRGLGPARVLQPLHDPRPAQLGERVDLAVRALGLVDALGAHEPRAFQTRERHVDLTGVEGVGERAERELQACAQLVTVRGLVREEREQHLLDDAQLVAACGLGARLADRLWDHDDDLSSLTVIYCVANRYLRRLSSENDGAPAGVRGLRGDRRAGIAAPDR